MQGGLIDKIVEHTTYTCDNCGQQFEIDPHTFDWIGGCDKPGCLVMHHVPEPTIKGVRMSVSFMTEFRPMSPITKDLCKTCYHSLYEPLLWKSEEK